MDKMILENYDNLYRTVVGKFSKRRIKIGFVGFSTGPFNATLASSYIKSSYETIKNHHDKRTEFAIVSGLTNMGIPGLVYSFAKSNDVFTIGVACKKCFDYEVFPVDESLIIGENWGDESEVFLNQLDYLVRIGGGEQSMKEVEIFKNLPNFKENKLFEFELEKFK
jgi:hypothetical protein